MTTETQTSAPVLPAALRMGAVELTVTDLDRSVHFYETAIGLVPRAATATAPRSAPTTRTCSSSSRIPTPAAPAATPASTTSRS